MTFNTYHTFRATRMNFRRGRKHLAAQAAFDCYLISIGLTQPRPAGAALLHFMLKISSARAGPARNFAWHRGMHDEFRSISHICAR